MNKLITMILHIIRHILIQWYGNSYLKMKYEIVFFMTLFRISNIISKYDIYWQHYQIYVGTL